MGSGRLDSPRRWGGLRKASRGTSLDDWELVKDA